MSILLPDRPADGAPAPARRLPVPPRPHAGRAGVGLAVVVGLLVAAHVVAIRQTEVSITALIDGWSGITRFLGDAFPPDLTWDTVVRPGIEATITTFWIGLLGTTLSIPLTVVLTVLGARTTTPNAVVYQVARAVMSFLRAVPDIVFALIFVTAVGLGPFPGVLAILLHNAGVMGKLWSEAVEEMDQGPVTALRTTGAKRPQVLAHAVLPTVVPQLIGLLLYRLDVNVRSSLVLGLVGAGGIGFLINKSIKLFQFDEMLTYILIVLVLIVVVDQVSGAVRRRLAR
ncbi:phosphonate ABC transporter, permease protein PhnE [Nocardioides lianchengensis]|uniref:Phosphonate transport system permease protein n=1 Tax=Nocardioides lianchengensis TaxID=1045774 RepID=A0A1G7C5X1_9ACTN|nr:phosphonate ABC transporter, permease protein PhnE [Nocardioides lianchengensis]NYG09259.1 phosphonate transport system permease protein [Nocardioides lianchengensis]SDE34709.1 phosphonate transport system permease protein [Nocardioides lianchengensis]